ncbi:MAG TPA: SgcJ/EcaC family oxidoreductase [Anaerolineae bacterium]
MSSETSRRQGSPAAGEGEVGALYRELLDSWNRRSARDFAALFEEDGHSIGFDGSTMNGRAEIEAHIGAVFADHVTATYVGKIRGVRFLTPEVAILRAVVGMVPPGQSAINPAANAIQTAVAAKDDDGQWRIALFQNTPAQFHGRPELAQALTVELGELLA